MSESKTVTIPLEIPQPQPQPQQPAEKPAWAKRSLHNVKLNAPQAETETVSQWTDHGDRASVRFEQRPIEQTAQPPAQPHQPPQPYGAPEQYAQPYGERQPQLQPPNPEDFDFWDTESAQEYRRQSDAYMQEMISRGVQEVVAPYHGALTEAMYHSQYNAVLAEHGDDPNFQATMKLALKAVADSGGKVDIPTAYAWANDPKNAQLGRPGNAHLPESLRQHKKVSQLRLGAIAQHNHETGRAVPFQKRRGW